MDNNNSEGVEAEILAEDEVLQDGAVAPVESGSTASTLTLPDSDLSPASLPQVDISAEDMEFLGRVFSQVKDVDFRTPPPPPPKGLTGPDKKLADLREMVRRLERDLARVGYIWSGKQEQIDALDAILAAKEQERAHAVQRYAQLRDHAKRAVALAKEEAAAVRALVGTLTSKKNELEQTLQQKLEEHHLTVTELRDRVARQEQEQAALLADFRGKIEQAQTAFSQLREQSARSMGALDAQVKARDEQIEALRQDVKQAQARIVDRDATLEAQRREANAMAMDLNKRITELETRLATANEQVSQNDAKVLQRDQTITSLAAKLTEREKTAAQLVEEMSRLRTEQEARLNDVRDSQKTADQEIARLKGELATAAAEQAALKEAHEKRGQELERLKQRLTGI